MSVSSAKRGAYPTYQCNNADCSRRVTISAERIEQDVATYVEAAIAHIRESARDDAEVREAETELEHWERMHSAAVKARSDRSRGGRAAAADP